MKKLSAALINFNEEENGCGYEVNLNRVMRLYTDNTGEYRRCHEDLGVVWVACKTAAIIQIPTDATPLPTIAEGVAVVLTSYSLK